MSSTNNCESLQSRRFIHLHESIAPLWGNPTLWRMPVGEGRRLAPVCEVAPGTNPGFSRDPPRGPVFPVPVLCVGHGKQPFPRGSHVQRDHSEAGGRQWLLLAAILCFDPGACRNRARLQRRLASPIRVRRARESGHRGSVHIASARNRCAISRPSSRETLSPSLSCHIATKAIGSGVDWWLVRYGTRLSGRITAEPVRGSVDRRPVLSVARVTNRQSSNEATGGQEYFRKIHLRGSPVAHLLGDFRSPTASGLGPRCRALRKRWRPRRHDRCF